ncbi:GNAT family N-acetyltransferase [Megasphaera vaginalis (ex Bordigoni et al. 2020)]|uniref:GNAT family N-acetyltransferase n=1 Tax=Megasphaera vaginalis (ex Bordigoni et al. 2020) TaxID=2045301 RepID=UPI001F465445|nr:GNAT family N-acetyltransferase [Megasphaera vaginalis (ex Bordigoni et al. 2020)]
MMMKIIDGSSRQQDVKELIMEYTEGLHLDLTFQDLAEELRTLAKYLPPKGRMLLAIDDTGAPLGTVSYTGHSTHRCEMKRLYVKPAYRKEQIGKKLAVEIIHLAQGDGYSEMVLDTLHTMPAAIHLYRALGFSEMSPYYDNPLEGVIFMKKTLNDI